MGKGNRMTGMKKEFKITALLAAMFVIVGVPWVIPRSPSLSVVEADELSSNGLWYVFMPILFRTEAPPGDAFYVSPSGSNSNPGTIHQPWRTIDYAANNAAVGPGDVVYIRGGTYREAITQGISGAPGQPITFRNYPGESPIITKTGERWLWRVDDHSHLRFQGLTFSNYSRGGMSVKTDSVSVTDIAVVGCTFKHQSQYNGEGSHALYFNAAKAPSYRMTNVTARGNYFYDINTCYSDGRCSEVLTATGHVSGVRFLDNAIQGTTGIGIDIIGRSTIGQPENVLIKGNTIHDWANLSDGAGIYLDCAAGNAIIEDNVLDTGLAGIHISCESGPVTMRMDNIIVRRNIIYDAKYGLMLGIGDSTRNCDTLAKLYGLAAAHNTVYTVRDGWTAGYFACSEDGHSSNNIYVHTSNETGYLYNLYNATADPRSWTTDYNLFHPVGTGKYWWQWRGIGTYTTLAAFQSGTGLDVHSLEANPLFVDPASRDFRLQPGSPAIDAAGPLALTAGTGSGAVVGVTDARYFTDGFGLQAGDTIRVGDDVVAVVDVNYAANTLTVNRSISWLAGQAVNYDYVGSGPDLGAYEMEGQDTSYSQRPTAGLCP